MKESNVSSEQSQQQKEKEQKEKEQKEKEQKEKEQKEKDTKQKKSRKLEEILIRHDELREFQADTSHLLAKTQHIDKLDHPLSDGYQTKESLFTFLDGYYEHSDNLIKHVRLFMEVKEKSSKESLETMQLDIINEANKIEVYSSALRILYNSSSSLTHSDEASRAFEDFEAETHKAISHLWPLAYAGNEQVVNEDVLIDYDYFYEEFKTLTIESFSHLDVIIDLTYTE